MDRKEMIKKIGEHLGVKPVYLSVPTFAYEIRTEDETYTIDRVGNITNSRGESITMEEILNPPAENTQTVESTEEEPVNTAAEDGREEAFTEVEGNENSYQITLPLEAHSGRSLKNLINMMASKQHLLMQAFEGAAPFVDDTLAEDLENEELVTLEDVDETLKSLDPGRHPGLHFDFERNTITYRLEKTELSAEEKAAFKDLCTLIDGYGRTLKRASFKQAQDDNPKYALRTWLIRIGMNGSDYKETRKTLLKKLEGSGAFRKAGE